MFIFSIFLINNELDHLSMDLWPFQISCNSSSHVFIFCLLVYFFLPISEDLRYFNYISVLCVENFFTKTVACLFTILMDSSLFILISWVDFFFCLKCTYLKSWRYSPLLSSRFFIVLSFILLFNFYIKSSFCVWHEVRAKFHLYFLWIWNALAWFIEKCFPLE